MEEKEFAKKILEAQKIREESWDSKEKKYLKDHGDAVLEACGINKIDKRINNILDTVPFAYPMYMLNIVAWNDIQEWATTILSKE